MTGTVASDTEAQPALRAAEGRYSAAAKTVAERSDSWAASSDASSVTTRGAVERTVGVIDQVLPILGTCYLPLPTYTTTNYAYYTHYTYYTYYTHYTYYTYHSLLTTYY